MDIEIKDTLTLSDGNKYIVVSKTNSNGKTYYYLVDLVNNKNIKFCEEDHNELVEIENSEIIRALLPLFVNASKDILNEILEEQN